MVFDKPPPEPVIPADPWYQLMDVVPLEVQRKTLFYFFFSIVINLQLARQMTILAFGKYKAIQADEFLNLAWSKKEKEINSPNLLAMIRLYNKVKKNKRRIKFTFVPKIKS